MGGLWVILCISLKTDLMDTKCYGIREVMGFQRYGIREVQPYNHDHPYPSKALINSRATAHSRGLMLRDQMPTCIVLYPGQPAN